MYNLLTEHSSSLYRSELDRLNVLSAPLVRQLRRALDTLVADAEVRTVVLTGADPGFSAGGDLTMMRAATEQLSHPEGVAGVWRWIRREFGGIARRIAGSDTIVVAALNGTAAFADSVRTLLTGPGGQA